MFLVNCFGELGFILCEQAMKVAKKIQAQNVHGYANDSNPFGDSNLNEKYVRFIFFGLVTYFMLLMVVIINNQFQEIVFGCANFVKNAIILEKLTICWKCSINLWALYKLIMINF